MILSSMSATAELGIRISNFSDSVEKELVSRCIKVFRFEPHSQRKSVLILGNVTVTVIIPVSGKVERQFTQDFTKTICLLGLSNGTNAEKIVKEILTMCPFIDNSLLPSLIEVIDDLKSRDYDHNGVLVHREIAADGSFLPRPKFLGFFDNVGNSNEFDEDCNTEEEPDFGRLDHYIDLLYEDLPRKIEASHYISKLSECNSYLMQISRHDSAINALFRTLREDSKKSARLTKNILTICCHFAKIRDFHGLLVSHKIPILCLEIIDFELERCEKWKSQLIEHEASATKNVTVRSLDECQAMWVRLTELTAFQNGVLHIAFQILYCLSEDKRVRESLVQHKVIISLGDALERRNNNLLEVVTAFLKNLSSYKQCIGDTIAGEILEKLSALLKEGSPIPKKIVGNALHLIYNLSFCTQLRQKIFDCGLISIIANCFEKPMFHEITARILYVLSMDPAFRIKLIKAPLIDGLMSYLTEPNAVDDSDNTVTIVAVSLILNLSRNKRGAKFIWETKKLGLLTKRGLHNQDFFILKIVRSLTEQDTAFILHDYAGKIANAMANSGVQEFVMECIGILSCFDLAIDHVFESVVRKGQIFPWLKQTLSYYLDKLYKASTPSVTFDLTRASIDAILLLTNICTIEEGARLVVGQGFMEILLKILLFETKREESVIDHIFFCFEICTKHESISIYLATKTRLANGLLEIAEGTKGKLRQKSILILEQIGNFDDQWKENVQQFNFLIWNKEWTDIATENDMEEDDSYDSQVQMDHKFRFQEDSCARSKDAIRSLYNGNSTDESTDEECPFFSDNDLNDSDDRDSDVFEMFRQQFEKDTGINSNMIKTNGWKNMNETGEFWLESNSEAGSD